MKGPALEVAPVTFRDACAFIRSHHRHHNPPRGQKIAVAALSDGRVVGVGVAGRPVARNADDGRTLEITRVCTDGTPNACSCIYGALVRAGRALGFRRFLTYTLPTETGASLRGAGWRRDGETGEPRSWDRTRRPRDPRKHPLGSKVRWCIP